jgi:hypothetical protein
MPRYNSWTTVTPKRLGTVDPVCRRCVRPLGMDDALALALETGRLRRRLPDAKTRRMLRERADTPQKALAQALGVDRAFPS